MVPNIVVSGRRVCLTFERPHLSQQLAMDIFQTLNVGPGHECNSIQEAIELLLSRGISGLPVATEGGHLVGVITEFALLAIAYDHEVQNQTVEQHMTKEVITVDASEPVNRVADLCIVHRVRRVPVMEGGRLVGLISRRDVLNALYQAEAAACRV